MMIEPIQGEVPPWVTNYLQRAQAQAEVGNMEAMARANLSRQLTSQAIQFGGRGLRAGAEFVKPGLLLAEDASRLPEGLTRAAGARAAKGFVGIPTALQPLPEGVPAAAPSMLSKVASGVGTAAGALSLGVAGAQVAQDPKNALAPSVLQGGARERNQQRALGLGQAALGGVTGAKVGATAGTVVAPGLGTAIGGIVGGALGALSGIKSLFGKKAHSEPAYRRWYVPRR